MSLQPAKELDKMLQNRRVLLLSPHPDDIAYSCGGLVAAHVGTWRSAFLLTVFSRSVYAGHKDYLGMTEDKVTGVRASEDQAYCDRYGMQRVDLGFRDAGLAGYDDDTELLGTPSEDGRMEEVAAEVCSAIERVEPECVLAPAAIGNHIDHAIVRDAALKWRESFDHLLFYEDIPYVTPIDLAEIDRYASTVLGCDHAVSCCISDVIEEKTRDMYGYRSQVDGETMRLMKEHASRVASWDACAERLWRHCGMGMRQK